MIKYLLFNFILVTSPVMHDSITKVSDEDTKSVQNLLNAYYDCISGPIGETRDFDRFRNLFHPSVSFTYSYWNADQTEAKTMVFNSAEAFIAKLDYLDKKGFYEHEISNTVNRFGAVIQVFSTYAYRTEDESIPPGRGITSYEIFFDGQRYWIMSMFWMAENDRFSIPDNYLQH